MWRQCRILWFTCTDTSWPHCLVNSDLYLCRRGHTVLKIHLPAKEENVILVRLSQIQRDLYTQFMDRFRDCGNSGWLGLNPLKAFCVCCKVCWGLGGILRYRLRCSWSPGSHACWESLIKEEVHYTEGTEAKQFPEVPLVDYNVNGAPCNCAAAQLLTPNLRNHFLSYWLFFNWDMEWLEEHHGTEFLTAGIIRIQEIYSLDLHIIRNTFHLILCLIRLRSVLFW